MNRQLEIILNKCLMRLWSIYENLFPCGTRSDKTKQVWSTK